MTTKWELRANGLVEELKGLTDKVKIESLVKEVMLEIKNAYPNLNSRKNPLSDVRKVVFTAFPDTEKQVNEAQYYTNSGKGNLERYQHLALKFLTLPKEDWNELGDEARKEYQETKEVQSKKSDMTATTPTIEPIKLSDMKIDFLALDIETEQNVLNALENSGKSLAEFMQLAAKAYANILNRQTTDIDLTTVSTSELLDPEITKYKSHPKKIEELTKRAIKAIMTHNDNSTETDQKWFISGTAINGLTGSRVQSVNEILKDYKQMVDGHNSKHGLTAYTNRGSAKNREIKHEIPLTSLVLDGTDL